MDMPRRLGAEFFGTFWLTFAGCGSAVLAAGFPSLGIGFLGVSFAFGLTVLTMAYAVGHISGGHFNCAVTVGLWAGGRFKGADVIPYILAQVVGAIAAAAVLYLVASGKPDWVPGGFASNGFGDLSFAAAAKHGVKTEGNSAAANAKVLAELASLIDTGRLEIPIAKVYHLADVREAYQDLARRHIRGKIVLIP